ncbi:hypothetical protein EDD16DRAFT_1596975 [Pisolithus croceorrhizus]|nr:hypothetical protein EDD16DRAFT_1596975 [Pisolithus croceorrhizus]
MWPSPLLVALSTAESVPLALVGLGIAQVPLDGQEEQKSKQKGKSSREKKDTNTWYWKDGRPLGCCGLPRSAWQAESFASD